MRLASIHCLKNKGSVTKTVTCSLSFDIFRFLQQILSTITVLIFATGRIQKGFKINKVSLGIFKSIHSIEALPISCGLHGLSANGEPNV